MLVSKGYHIAVDPDGKAWYYKNPGDVIFVWVAGNKSEVGFVSLPMEDGRTLLLDGPWLTNPQSLLDATGIDCRKKESHD